MGSKQFIFKESIVGSAQIYRQKHLVGVMGDSVLRSVYKAAGVKVSHQFHDASARQRRYQIHLNHLKAMAEWKAVTAVHA
ncbi:hypothetical protein B5P45_09940 [Phyllobacterium zundukense]|uniref:Uncharacterized protein n=1 Tax=Phyllobacterium zundukense TaxID=1867719 RepID=A0A2N9VZQ8_9HYPH|nr:hypothetical protein BLM14_21580 [Phyllobacterium zundukense]PIO44976.1 hypothetical protein B5P45_09940 [Phyllobacterium zundukense]